MLRKGIFLVGISRREIVTTNYPMVVISWRENVTTNFQIISSIVILKHTVLYNIR